MSGKLTRLVVAGEIDDSGNLLGFRTSLIDDAIVILMRECKMLPFYISFGQGILNNLNGQIKESLMNGMGMKTDFGNFPVLINVKYDEEADVESFKNEGVAQNLCVVADTCGGLGDRYVVLIKNVLV